MRRILLAVFINLLLIVVLLELGTRLLAGSLPATLGVAARWVVYGSPFQQAWTPAWQTNIDHYWALRPNLQDVVQYGSPSVSFRLSTVELWEGGGIGFRTAPIDFFVDAVVVGDSFGMCFTEQADCWVDQLQALSGQKIVNLSQPVTGTTSHGRILRDFGAPLNPPMVIWQFFGNDFNDDYGLGILRDEIRPPEDESPATSPAITPLQWLRRNSAAWAVIETAFTGRIVSAPDSEALYLKPYRASYGEPPKILQFGGLYELQALDMSREVNQIGLELSRRAFRQAQALIAEWEGDLRVVLIPTREEVYAHLTAPIMGQAALDTLSSARLAMLSLCDELALTCLDPYEMFKARALNDEALYFSDDMHLNPHGNRVLAEWLAEQLP